MGDIGVFVVLICCFLVAACLWAAYTGGIGAVMKRERANEKLFAKAYSASQAKADKHRKVKLQLVRARRKNNMRSKR